MSTYSIQLTRSAQVPHNVGNIQGYQYIVVASDAVNLPNEVFRMYQRPLDPIAQTRVAVYRGIATPTELQNLPINAPLPPNYWYRVATIEVCYTSVNFGEEQWQAIQSDVTALLRSLAAGDNLSVVDTVQLFSGG